jgi:hypothetical protein
MENLNHLDVFSFLVKQKFKRAAAGMWLDLFEDRLRREIVEASSASESGAASAADGIAAGDVGTALRRMFEWLAGVALHYSSAKTFPPETIDAANWVRQEITHECVRNINEWNQFAEWPPVYRELLMILWDDGWGNLLFRTIREVQDERTND